MGSQQLPQNNSVDPLLSLVRGQKGSSRELSRLRALLKNTEVPQMQVAPINDIGDGIMVGSTAIANAIINRQNQAAQQQMMAAELARMEQEAQLQEQQQAATAQYLGVPPDVLATMPDSAITAMVNQRFEQEKALANQDLTNRAWEDKFKSALIAQGVDPNSPTIDPTKLTLARDVANEVYGKGGGLSTSPLTQTIGRDLTFNQSQSLLGNVPNTGTLSPGMRTSYQAAFGTQPQDMVDQGARQADTSLKQAEATYRPSLLATQVQGNQLGNEGKALQNQFQGIQNARENTIWGAQQTALSNPAGPVGTNFLQAMSVLQPNLTSSVYGKGKPYENYAKANPDMSPEAAQTPGQGAFKMPQITFDTRSLAPFGQVAFGSPQERIQGLGQLGQMGWNALSDPNNVDAIYSGLQSLQPFYSGVRGALQNFPVTAPASMALPEMVIPQRPQGVKPKK